MKKGKFIILAVLIACGIIYYNYKNEPVEIFKEMVEVSIIPKPNEVTINKGGFNLKNNIPIIVVSEEGKKDELLKIAKSLKDNLERPTGFNFPIENKEGAKGGAIVLQVDNTGAFKNLEEYSLHISENKIIIKAGSCEGVYRGVSTLMMLFPKEILSKEKVQNVEGFTVPALEIADYPEYGYRGVMIDVARHFFSKEEILRQIDLLSQYKINKLHLHLSDDQGWRLEIKKYPELTLIGGSTEVGGGKGGYYTQEDFKEIVAYGKERYVDIIPEFDMPGHTNAALASLGFLNEDGKRKPLYTGIEVGFSTLMTRSEKTYEFIDQVFKEVSEISPSRYIHVGGDEALKTKKEDYDYFEGRVKEICEKYNKIPIGWDPIDTAPKIGKGVVLQNWQDSNAEAVRKEMNILVSLAKRCYLDMKYNKDTPYGLDWAGLISIKDGYEWDITDFAPRNLALGLEGALWTETISTELEMDYMIYPRAIGYSEIGWTKKELRNYNDYVNRLRKTGERLEFQKVNFYKDPSIWSN